MLEALEKLAPGVYSRHTLLYGVEVKFYSNRIEVTPEMETTVKNLFAVGTGPGSAGGCSRHRQADASRQGYCRAAERKDSVISKTPQSLKSSDWPNTPVRQP